MTDPTTCVAVTMQPDPARSSYMPRIEMLIARCREASMEEPFLVALARYLAGQGPLGAVMQEWQVKYRQWPILFPDKLAAVRLPPYSTRHPEDAAEDANTSTEADDAQKNAQDDAPPIVAYELDDMDRRALDLCNAIGQLERYFDHLPVGWPIEASRDYLMAQGMPEIGFVGHLSLYTTMYGFATGRQPAFAELIRTYVPNHFPALLRLLTSAPSWNRQYQEFAQLLLDGQPPFVDEAWQVAQCAEQNGVTHQLGDMARLLLDVDFPRFRDWAIHIADTGSPTHDSQRAAALEALLEHDRAGAIELAAKLVKEPPNYRWDNMRLQKVALKAVYAFDAVRYWPLIEWAATAPRLGATVIELLGAADATRIEPARLVLQSIVRRGEIDVARTALPLLLSSDTYAWDGRFDFAVEQLSHRSKHLREETAAWLAQQGAPTFDRVVPLLDHKSADARVAAVQTLTMLDGDRARSLLAPQIDGEKSQNVRQAMLDVLGASAAPNADTTAPATVTGAVSSDDFLANIIARARTDAEVTLKRVAKPAPEWATLPEVGALRWANGAPVAPLIVGYWLYRQSRDKGGKLDDAIRTAIMQVDHASAATCARALWQAWLGRAASAKDSWVLPLVGALGDDTLVVPMRKQIDEWGKGARGAMAAKTVQALALQGSDLALSEVADIAARFKHTLVRTTARAAFDAMADYLGVTQEELADRITPRLGFDANGRRVFDYGARQFTVSLGHDLTLQVADGADKRVATLPKPGARDDPTQANNAYASWKTLKGQLQQSVKIQAQRLEKALVDQRAWPAARWRASFQGHPLLRSFAVTLVWGLLAANGARDGGATSTTSPYVALFRPLEDGTLTDADDAPVTLPATGAIRLAHPLELSAETREQWLRHLADYEMTPPFAQLTRPTVAVRDEERGALWWGRYLGYVMNGATLWGKLEKLGWRRGSVQDGGIYYTLFKEFPGVGVEAALETAGLSVGYEMGFNSAIKRLGFVRVDTVKRGDYFYDDLNDADARLIALGDVPPVVFSEAAANVQAAAAGGEYAPDWEKKVW
ncbi:MAG TPA: DUF4132 domain-containing protein [Ktedonobacterales bacterium]|nr:DUF4132 domain-containing protein [Ktedonobacterales bacterium]